MRMFCDVFTQHIHMGNIYIHHGGGGHEEKEESSTPQQAK